MSEAFLRLPPFPGHRAPPLAVRGFNRIDYQESAKLVRLLKAERVGGNFWGGRPEFPEGRDLVLAPSSRVQALEMFESARAESMHERCIILDCGGLDKLKTYAPFLASNTNSWHIANLACQVWVDADQEMALIASLTGRQTRIFGNGRFENITDEGALERIVGSVISDWNYACPFSGESIEPDQVIELLKGWRRLIDRNRTILSVFGIARWKRPTVDPMLWDGTSSPRHASRVPGMSRNHAVIAAWKSRTPEAVLDRIARSGFQVAEIEDGMIRGRGLGANCVPPFSIVVDFTGIYFDPAKTSDLERILETADLDDALLERAARLRRMIVAAGISKYDGGAASEVIEFGGKRRVLVLGQVEDDRSVLNGGPGQTNLGLLMKARELEPEAWLIYRPHPDVEAGHRKGHIPDQHALEIANDVERGGSFVSLIENVDSVHCITSLGGFEALLRGKQVTVHGAPFYAGWGLTTDLGPVPLRRTRKRSLDELVAAALIIYPTYFDPITRLPCPPEVLVGRIARGEDGFATPLAWPRSLQGKLKVALRRIREAAA